MRHTYAWPGPVDGDGSWNAKCSCGARLVPAKRMLVCFVMQVRFAVEQ